MLWKSMEAEKLIFIDEHSGRVYRTNQKKVGSVYLWLYKSAMGKNGRGRIGGAASSARG